MICKTVTPDKKNDFCISEEPFFYEEWIKKENIMSDSDIEIQEKSLTFLLIELGSTCCLEGNYSYAESLYKRALKLLLKDQRFNHPELPELLKKYASLLKRTGREVLANGLEVCSDVIQQNVWLRI